MHEIKTLRHISKLVILAFDTTLHIRNSCIDPIILTKYLVFTTLSLFIIVHN